MAPRLRRVLRLLRVLVACVALGVVASPAPAPTWVDAVAWVAPGRGATQAEAPSVPHAAPRWPNTPATDALGERATPPPGARAVVVQHRVYLRHAALLC
jgi:hypothetical protein